MNAHESVERHRSGPRTETEEELLEKDFARIMALEEGCSGGKKPGEDFLGVHLERILVFLARDEEMGRRMLTA